VICEKGCSIPLCRRSRPIAIITAIDTRAMIKAYSMVLALFARLLRLSILMQTKVHPNTLTTHSPVLPAVLLTPQQSLSNNIG